MTKKILIAGGSGMIGKRLTAQLLARGFSVAHLGRSAKKGNIPGYTWDPERGTYDADVLDNVEVFINLAGAGVAEKRWTSERKKIIRDSRIKSVALLATMIKNSQVKIVIGASAIGYYGFSDEKTFEENDPEGSDFLAQVVKEWEDGYAPVYRQEKRVVNFRIGIVLAQEGGALQEIAKPIRWLAGAPLGKGDQMMSWIHIDDLCAMFIKAIERNDIRGVYNAVSPNPVSNKEMTYAIAKYLRRPILIPFVPSLVLKIILGEMASIVLKGSKVSSKKIEATGFKFSFSLLEPALRDLLKK